MIAQNDVQRPMEMPFGCAVLWLFFSLELRQFFWWGTGKELWLLRAAKKAVPVDQIDDGITKLCKLAPGCCQSQHQYPLAMSLNFIYFFRTFLYFVKYNRTGVEKFWMVGDKSRREEERMLVMMCGPLIILRCSGHLED